MTTRGLRVTVGILCGYTATRIWDLPDASMAQLTTSGLLFGAGLILLLSTDDTDSRETSA